MVKPLFSSFSMITAKFSIVRKFRISTVIDIPILIMWTSPLSIQWNSGVSFTSFFDEILKQTVYP